MTTQKKGVRRVKAWAVISPEGYVPMWGNRQMLIYSTRKSARENRYDAYAENGNVYPCTITYTLSTNRKKK